VVYEVSKANTALLAAAAQQEDTRATRCAGELSRAAQTDTLGGGLLHDPVSGSVYCSECMLPKGWAAMCGRLLMTKPVRAADVGMVPAVMCQG
jgi:hypothetical protein